MKTNRYLNITKLPTVENRNRGDPFTIRGISAMEDSFDDEEKKILVNENIKCGELSNKNNLTNKLTLVGSISLFEHYKHYRTINKHYIL